MDLVSCLCVTRARPAMLRRAVAAFHAQTHAERELVVVFESDDGATRACLEGLAGPSLRAVEVPAAPKRTLGELRNICAAAARGRYVAQWDDDDWHAPGRLAAQLAVARGRVAAGCVLLRWTLYDAPLRQAYVSGRRTWEGSLLIERAALPPYPALARGEDSEVVKALLAAGRLCGLDHRPELYVYVHHGANTWGRAFFKRNMAAHAEALCAAETRRIERLLGVPGAALAVAD
ncbi:MAG TPA: glycosyltransferase family A protein [Myxococcota bacterium]|nr:glycosyltransferase family A protein [Myxococcota bacterium]